MRGPGSRAGRELITNRVRIGYEPGHNRLIRIVFCGTVAATPKVFARSARKQTSRRLIVLLRFLPG